MHGLEWIVDARGCHPAALSDETRLRALFDRLVADLALTPVAPAVWHRFPTPGGLTGVVVLAESHLAIHTWPEIGAVTLDIYVCNFSDDNSARAQALFAEALARFAPARVERHSVRRGQLVAA